MRLRLRRSRPLAKVAAADLRAFSWVVSHRTPRTNRAMRRLSTSANHGVLWAGVAAGIALTGGRFGRRAALRGMISLGIASMVANGPAKMWLQRQRPPIALVPQARRLARVPVTWSLPSGHSASAAAFATGVALETPRMALPVGALASAVGYSRVHTGVHYPGDVLAGATIGMAAAFLTTLWWPRSVIATEALPEHKDLVDLPERRDGEGVAIFVNSRAGSVAAEGDSIVEGLEAALPRARIEVTEPDDLHARLRAAADGADVLGIVGGDGSMRVAATVAHKLGKPLLAVPGGTLNHLARDLGLADEGAAVDALKSGTAVTMDVGMVGEHTFCNAASVGVYADLVDSRERLERRIGKWPALVVGLARVLRDARPLELVVDGRAETVWMLYAGNCRYAPDGFMPAERARLDDGLLDVRMVSGDRPFARTRLIAAVMTGTLGRCRVYRAWTANEVSVQSQEGPLRVAADGETLDGLPDISFRKAPRGLVVYTHRAD